jgi:hypothetical protein
MMITTNSDLRTILEESQRRLQSLREEMDLLRQAFWPSPSESSKETDCVDFEQPPVSPDKSK